MTGPFVLTLAVFMILGGLTLRSSSLREGLFSRARDEWWVDGLSLLNQGLLVPLAAMAMAGGWAFLFPTFKGALHISSGGAFLLSFVGVDYLYYWNHRLLHTNRLWRWHQLHHTATHLDLLVSSRNTVLTPALLVFLWANSIFLFLLHDPVPYLWAHAIGAALDLWRHSGFYVRKDSGLFGLLAPWLVLPQDHGWHHSSERFDCNFGYNLSLWDRWHQTLYRTDPIPSSFGQEPKPTLNGFFVPLNKKSGEM